jgi:hypothetical protein
MHAREMRDFGSMADYLSRVLAHDPDNVDLLQQGFIAMASGGRLSEAAEIGRKWRARRRATYHQPRPGRTRRAPP